MPAKALAGAVLCITGTLSVSRCAAAAAAAAQSALPPSARWVAVGTPDPRPGRRAEMTKKLKAAGAVVGGGVTTKTTHLISTPAEVASKTTKVCARHRHRRDRPSFP